jgi:hypothetical protein
MASSNVIGLLMEIGADPSKAESAMARLDAASVASSAKVSSVWTGAMNAITGPTGMVLGAFTGLGAAALATAQKAAQAGGAIYEASEKTGMSAQALSGVMALAKESGKSFESISMGFGRALRNLAQAADTGKGALISYFSQAELESLKLKPVDERMHFVLQRIFAISDESERARALQALLGKGWQDNIEVLKELAEQGYAPAIQKAKDLGVYYDEESARKMRQFEREWATLKSELEGTALTIGQKLVPSFLSLFNAAEGFHASTELSWWEGYTQRVKDLSASVLYFAGTVHNVLTEAILHERSVLLNWSNELLANSKILDQMTASILRADPASLTYAETMAKIAAATELAKQKHISLTQALYELAHARAAAQEGDGGMPPPGAPAKGGKSAAAQQAQDAEHLAATYGKLVTVLVPATDAVQHFGKAFEPLASGRLSLPQLDANLLSSLGIVRQTVPAYERLSVGARLLATAHKDLTEVHKAFTQALHGEFDALTSMTEKAGSLAGDVAGRIGGKKLEAEVRGGFDVAMSIEEMAQFIASWGADTAAFAASIKYGAAAEEMFKVAGRGGGRGAGGGGGYGGAASPRMASYGGGPEGRGAEAGGRGGGAASPGAASPGAAVHIEYYGPVVTDQNSTQQLFDQWSQAVRDGTLDLTSSRASIQGPTTTGRG